MEERAYNEVNKLLNNYNPSSVQEEIKMELINIMELEAKNHGQDKLPERI